MPTRSGNARGRASRQRLLDAAAGCFGERGYSGTRIADITAAAGMSQGAFYRHFKDKDGVLVEALRGPLDELLAATAVDAGVPADEAALVAANTAFFCVYARHRHVLRVIREAAALHEPGLVELWLEVRSAYVARIEAWLRRLEPDTSDVPLLAEALGAVLDQMAYTRIGLATTDPGDAEVARLGRVAGELWYRAVSG